MLEAPWSANYLVGAWGKSEVARCCEGPLRKQRWEIALKVAKFNEENDVQLLDNLGAHKGPSSPPPKTPPRNEPNRTLCEPSFDGEAKPVNVNSTAVPHQKITAEEFQNKELLVLKLACVELRQADRLRRPTVVKQAAGGCL